MTPAPPGSAAETDHPETDALFAAFIRRLAQDASTLQAINLGEVDAILDSVSGRAILLPEAREALRQGAVPTNQMLATLPAEEYQRLWAVGLEPVTLAFGDRLHEPGELIQHIYFPSAGLLVSLLTTLQDHSALEIGLVGHEGMVGLPVAQGIDTSSVRAVVQGPGQALRMESSRFRDALEISPVLQRTFHRYTYALIAQITQTAVCNRFHQVEARLARWLLLASDRLQSNPLRFTHEALADLLGVRRVGITVAASALQQRKLIQYSRGNIKILNREGLQASACECYQKIKDIFDHV
jgi:CRP-like cAMP-binding protein